MRSLQCREDEKGRGALRRRLVRLALKNLLLRVLDVFVTCGRVGTKDERQGTTN